MDDEDTLHRAAVTSDATNITTMGKIVNDSPQQQEQQQLLLHHSAEASCSSCLWTGVLTSLGLSAYFAYIAFDDDDSHVIKPNVTGESSMTLPPKNPTFLQENKIIHSTTHNKCQSTGSTPSPISRPTTWFQQQVQKLIHYPSSPPPPLVSRYNKPVFLCISAGWFMVGVYRWHLG